ncbi:M48 family metallopeptidase [Sphingomonas sp.]|jgi:STE24 endopeptidase|uniref:M48 family metallopeptidase n=1 Tax=Sphingomonas sp. TaxID=28214 RepID=UPI00261066D1|nr:M48 family metallopeptidase [Sphingomonas sp.]MDF2604868.1 heat shock protein HtpX [Sphingomonas sp.]
MRKVIGAALLGAAALLPAIAQGQGANPGFDVDAATRAYLDLLQGSARAKSDAYFEGGYWLILWNAVVAVLVYGALLASGFSAWMRDLAERRVRRTWLVPGLYGVLFTLVSFLLFLPWTIYTGFVREAQYDLMSQTFGAWLIDQLKMLGVSLVVNALLFTAIYAVIRRFRRAWWAVGTAVVVGFLTIGLLLGPVFIEPLFNRYTEMAAGPLRDRIVAMAEAHHIPADHIYVADASRQTKRISANVAGLGPTIRIALNDNLLNRTSPDEVAAVMGHEMGHYVLGHIWRLLLWFALAVLVIFFALSRIAPRLIARHPRWGVRDVADPAGAPLLLAITSVLVALATPYISTVTRLSESEADRFGLDAARAPDGFATAAIRLSEYRKLEPGPIEEFVFFDHPSGATRVRMSMQWKKDNLPGANMVTRTLAK